MSMFSIVYLPLRALYLAIHSRANLTFSGTSPLEEAEEEEEDPLLPISILTPRSILPPEVELAATAAAPPITKIDAKTVSALFVGFGATFLTGSGLGAGDFLPNENNPDAALGASAGSGLGAGAGFLPNENNPDAGLAGCFAAGTDFGVGLTKAGLTGGGFTTDDAGLGAGFGSGFGAGFGAG